MTLPLILSMFFIAGVMVLMVGHLSAWLSKTITCISLLAAISLLLSHVPMVIQQPLEETFFLSWQRPWIEVFNVSFHLAASGFSFWLAITTLFLGLLAVFISKPLPFAHRFYACLCFTLMGVLGILFAVDLFLFFIFWEVALFPIYAMCFLYGPHNSRTTLRFIVYTQASGLILLSGILALVYVHFSHFSVLSFDYQTLTSQILPKEAQTYLFAVFMLAFLIKLPLFPLHGWMPTFFTELPVPFIVIGLLIKTSILGLVRFSWPLFPHASADAALIMMGLGVFSLLYGAVLAFAQREPKKLLAYATISHGGLLLMGVFSQNNFGLQGTIFLALTSSLSTACILAMLDKLYGEEKIIDLHALGGFFASAPSYATLILGFLLAGLGAPIFGNFVGEWLILWGAFAVSPEIVILAGVGVVLSAVYSLWLFQRLCFSTKQDVHVVQVSRAEIAVYGFFLVILLALGFYPKLILPFAAHQSLAEVQVTTADN